MQVQSGVDALTYPVAHAKKAAVAVHTASQNVHQRVGTFGRDARYEDDATGDDTTGGVAQ